MTITILLLGWIAVILGFNLWDYFVTKDGGKPNYIIYFLTRGAAAIVHGIICLIILEDRYTDYGSLSGWQLLALWFPYVGFQVCSFWIVYELVRNYWTDQPALYFDTVERDSGTIDKIFAKLGHTFHAFAKIITLALAVLCAVLIYLRH